MLVLSRHRGERILVGNDIVITIVDMQPGRVRVGISAPRDVLIVREELLPVGGSGRAPSAADEEGGVR